MTRFNGILRGKVSILSSPQKGIQDPGIYGTSVLQGMSVPGFLLALILLYWSGKYSGINISGLFSPAYSAQPEWTRGKIIDLLQHIWVPVFVFGSFGNS
jgi:peptide/nickel transport system permease protein